MIFIEEGASRLLRPLRAQIGADVLLDDQARLQPGVILLHPRRERFQRDPVDDLRIERVALLRRQIAEAALDRLFPVGIHAEEIKPMRREWESFSY